MLYAVWVRGRRSLVLMRYRCCGCHERIRLHRVLYTLHLAIPCRSRHLIADIGFWRHTTLKEWTLPVLTMMPKQTHHPVAGTVKHDRPDDRGDH